MDEEMGFLNSDDANEEKKKVAYLYVLDKKVVGCVTAEIIESAYELVEGGGAICRGRVGGGGESNAWHSPNLDAQVAQGEENCHETVRCCQE